MQSIHLFVGACAAALLGAITGASMNTSPLERGVGAWEQIPRHEASVSEFDAEAQRPALPDHYPLITPQGRFEVGELRQRGLYRNRRLALDTWWADPFEPAYEVAGADHRYIPGDTSEPATRDARETASGPARGLSPDPVETDQPVVLAAAESEALAPPPIEPPPALAGGVRRIDLAAELARRR